MPPADEAEAMNAVRDALFAALAPHENEAHGGESCRDNCLAALAWLAHCLGMPTDPGEVAEFVRLLDDYNVACKLRRCGFAGPRGDRHG